MKRWSCFAAIAIIAAAPASGAEAGSPALPKAKAPEAEKAFAEGRFADASRLLTAAIAGCHAPAAQPDHCLGLILLGASAASAAGQSLEAEHLATRALAIAETLPGGGKEEQVLALLSLGAAAVGQGKVGNGEQAYRKALAVAGVAVGARHPLTAMAENSLSSLLDAQGKLTEAETLHRRSIATIRTMLGPKSPALPTMIAGLADNLAEQARYGEAEQSYGEAIALARSLNGPAHPAVALGLNSLAVVKQKRGRFADAEALFREAAAIDRAALGANHSLVGRDASNLGALYLDTGRLSEAEAQFRIALAISEQQGADHPSVASDLGNLAGALRLQGRSEEAVAISRRALEIDRKAFGENSPRVAGHYGNIAANLEDQGRYGEAEAFRRRAFGIDRAVYGDANPETAASLANLATNLGRQDRSVEAEPLLRQALAVQRASFGERSTAVATADSQLGVLLARSGAVAAAEPLFRQALAIRRRVLGERHPDTAAAYYNLAAVLELMGRMTAAEAPARRALAIRRTVLAPSHPDVAVSETQLARILARDAAGRGEALGLLRDAMIIARGRRLRSFAGPAGGSIEIAQGRAASMGRTAADPLARTFAAFLTAAALRSIDAPGEAAALREEAFLAAQDIDVSAAGLAMAQTAARTAAGTGRLAALVRSQQDLASRSRLLDERLVEALGAAQEERATALRAELGRVGAELAAADEQLREAFPDYARLIFPGARSVAEVRRQLRPGEGLLLIRPAGDDIVVFAITPGQMAWQRVGGGLATVAARVAVLRCQVDPLTCSGKVAASAATFALVDTRAFDAASAFGLYCDIVKPVEAAIAGARRLYVTIGGPLADLPLDMLVTQAPPPSGDPEFLRRIQWLGDRYAMISLPAVSALSVVSRPEPRRPIAFVGYGAPVFAVSERMARFVAPSDPSGGSDTRSADRARLATLAPLPGTEVELRAMAKVLGASPRNIVLGPAATETALRADRRIASARVLAFATHGLLPRELNGRNEAALVLSLPKTITTTDDGLLTASEASELSIGADWVILSACNTASAEGGADSLSALSRGFLYAGAKALLASHWRVADDATAALTVETLATARRQPGLSRAEARQMAMRAVRTGRRADGSAIAGWTPDWLHPAAWAPFTLIAADDR